jgi:purine-cytosine permease-like protein
VDTFNRWFGTPTGLGALSVGMIAVLVVTCLAAILGHGTLEKGIRGINIVSIIIMMMLFAVFASRFRVTHGSNYLLGGFWPTWFIATTTTASLPISWGPFVGDYGRYIPSSAPSWKVSLYAVTGIFTGCWIAMTAAAFAATSFTAQAGDFVTGMTQAAPLWFLFPLLLVPGLASNIASAAMSLYNATLDIGAWPFFYRFKRWAITAAFGLVLLGLTYLFVVATNFLTNLEAFVTIMIVTATPWMVIVGIEFMLSRDQLAPIDLHAFAIPGMRGKYWFRNGVNPRAIIAWLFGAALGLMFSTNSLFTGPLENSVNGVDISWLVAGVAGGAVYLVLRYSLPATEGVAGVRDKDLADSVPGMDA